MHAVSDKFVKSTVKEKLASAENLIEINIEAILLGNQGVMRKSL